MESVPLPSQGQDPHYHSGRLSTSSHQPAPFFKGAGLPNPLGNCSATLLYLCCWYLCWHYHRLIQIFTEFILDNGTLPKGLPYRPLPSQGQASAKL